MPASTPAESFAFRVGRLLAQDELAGRPSARLRRALFESLVRK